MRHFITIAIISIVLFGCKKDDNSSSANVETKKIQLPDNKINKIYIDSKGIKWIATDKGLASFNDTNLTVYSTEADLADRYIADIAYEKTKYGDELWFATNKGVAVANYDVDAITSATTYAKDNSGILSENISSVAVGKSSVRFFATPLGLSIFNVSKWDTFYGRTKYEIKEVLKDNPISDIAIDSLGWVYATTLGGGVSKFKYEVDAVSGATTYTKDWAKGLLSDNVNTVLIVDDTCQWFGTDMGATFHGTPFTKTLWTKNLSTADGLICDTVTAIARDNSKNMWFGTTMGVSMYNGSSITNYTTDNGLVNNKVNSIAIDLDGSVWFGTNNGISHFANNKWTNYIKQ